MNKKAKKVTFTVGDLVNHKADVYGYIPMIVVEMLDTQRVKCRYFNDAQKKYTLSEFYHFELRERKTK